MSTGLRILCKAKGRALYQRKGGIIKVKLTKLTEKKKLMLISAACVIALAVILWPLLAISKYNYASADDWSYGVHTYQVLQNH